MRIKSIPVISCLACLISVRSDQHVTKLVISIDGGLHGDDNRTADYSILNVTSENTTSIHEPSSEYHIGSEQCSMKYACANTSPETKECSCHDYCDAFNACCADKELSHEASPFRRGTYYCIPGSYFGPSVNGNIYVVGKCPENFLDNTIRSLCDDAIGQTEIHADSSSTPVTDRVTGVTYRNIYCATCWGKFGDRVLSWLWKYSCSYELSSGINTENSQGASYANVSSIANATSQDVPATDNAPDVLEIVMRSCPLSYTLPQLQASAQVQYCQANVIGSCNNNISDLTLQQACLETPTQYAYFLTETNDWITYRNLNCARCNGIWNALRCSAGYGASVRSVSLGFDILLTPGSPGCKISNAFTLQATGGKMTSDQLCAALSRCNAGQGHIVWSTEACSLQCPVGSTYVAQECRVKTGFHGCTYLLDYTYIDSYVAKSLRSSFINDTFVIQYNETFAVCIQCIVKSLNKFSIDNDSLHDLSYPFTVYRSPFYQVNGTTATACIPLDNYSPAVSSFDESSGCRAIPEVVTPILLGFSETALILFLACFVTIRALRRFPGEMIANESCAYFVAFCLFLLRPAAENSPAACKAISVLLNYFFVAAFAWTALYATEVARALRFRVQRGGLRVRRTVYYVIGWGSPLCIVIAAVIADEYQANVRPSYGLPQCFIGDRLGNKVYLLAPLCASLLITISTYLYIIVALLRIARQTQNVRDAHNEKLVLGFKLIISLGLFWVFALLAAVTDIEELYCIYIVLDSLQGVFIFGVFICNKSVAASCRNLRRRVLTATSYPYSQRAAKSSKSTEI